VNLLGVPIRLDDVAPAGLVAMTDEPLERALAHQTFRRNMPKLDLGRERRLTFGRGVGVASSGPGIIRTTSEVYWHHYRDPATSRGVGATNAGSSLVNQVRLDTRTSPTRHSGQYSLPVSSDRNNTASGNGTQPDLLPQYHRNSRAIGDRELSCSRRNGASS